MSKSIQLSIPEPCHEGWDKMTQVERGRYCQSCQKTVVDFSQMSDKQIIEHISKLATQTCGHFYTDQLNRSLIEANEPKKSWWRSGWNMVAASFLFSTASYAQGNVSVKKTKPASVIVDKSCDSRFSIDGMIKPFFDYQSKVLDSKTLLPIEGVTVSYGDSNNAVLSDESGKFIAKAIPTHTTTELNFTAIGYIPLKACVNYFDGGAFKDRVFYLEQDYFELDTVVINDEALRNLSLTTYGFTVTKCYQEPTLLEKFVTNPLVRKIVDTFSSLKIYPNPAIAGSILNIEMEFSDKGPYKLELFNPVGQLVQLREIDVVKDQQLITIPLEKNLVKGMYIVRINHQESKKRYTKKVVVN